MGTRALQGQQQQQQQQRRQQQDDEGEDVWQQQQQQQQDPGMADLRMLHHRRQLQHPGNSIAHMMPKKVFNNN